MKTVLLAATVAATTALSAVSAAAAERYVLDASHSQVLFSYDHLGYSTTYNMFSGFDGEIMFDEQDPANSSVTVSMPLKSMFTGWEARFEHFMGDDFLGAQDGDLITFTSTAIEVTGDNTAKITGDLTIRDTTQSVVLDAVMNQKGTHPMAQKPWLGFNATTTILRSDFGAGAFAPVVSDELDVVISVEAAKAD
ncbi:MAG: YceI family protein [Pseudomonadota bacterium]